VWQEDAPVEVVGGIYSHLLGAGTPLQASDFAETLYLGVKVGAFELTPRTELSYAPYAFSVFSAQTVACSGAVGDIKHSILNPTQFATVNGDCWVPMDGRNIAGTQLATIMGTTTVPDMSGLFIRATEYNDGNDPDRSPMAAATLQTDEFKTHTHNFSGSTSNAGEHSHSIARRRNENNGAFDDNDAHATENSAATTDRSVIGTFNTSTAGGHTHTVSGTIGNIGGSETRAKNMNFYIYIRVD
jgi:microcystin-dependent protein